MRTARERNSASFDDSAASKVLNPNITEGSGCDGGGWLQTDPTDHYLYHAVIGRNQGALDAAKFLAGKPPGLYSMEGVLAGIIGGAT